MTSLEWILLSIGSIAAYLWWKGRSTSDTPPVSTTSAPPSTPWGTPKVVTTTGSYLNFVRTNATVVPPSTGAIPWASVKINYTLPGIL